MASSTSGAFVGPEWPGGQVTDCVTPGCCVTVGRPSGGVAVRGPDGDPWSIVGFTGFSSCAFSGACAPHGGSCTGCTGVDAPSACPAPGVPDCTSDRPSCSVATNGTATADAHVACGPAGATCTGEALTLAEAASRGLVTARSTGCFSGSCMTLRVTNAGVAGVVVHVAVGDVLVNRLPSGQNFVDLRAADVCVPANQTVETDLAVTCIDASKAPPDAGDLFDVGPPLASWPTRVRAAAELLRLVTVIDARQDWLASFVARAVWRVTDLVPLSPDLIDALDLLTAAGIDPAAPAGDLLHLTDPLAGSGDAASGLAPAPEFGPDGPCLFGLGNVPCDDGNACTTGDTCGNGSCAGAPVDPAVACDDGDACTTEACDPAVGCTHEPEAPTDAASVTCGVVNLEGILGRSPAPGCTRRCMTKLGHAFARVRHLMSAATSARSAHACVRKLHALRRAAAALERAVDRLATKGRIAGPPARAADLKDEAARLLGRVAAVDAICAAK